MSQAVACDSQAVAGASLIVRWPDQGTPQNFGETILLHFLIDMMVLTKNQEGVEV